MSQIKPILGHIDPGYVAPGIEKSAQGRMWCLRTDEDMPDDMQDEWGFQIHHNIMGFPRAAGSQNMYLL